MSKYKAHVPWLLRLPPGVRDGASWVFIGLLVGLSGLSFLFGVSESNVSQAIGNVGLRLWGGLLTFAGFGVMGATIAANHALERLALRILSVSIGVYCGWILTVVDWQRAAMTMALGAGLVVSAEIRLAVLKSLFSVAEARRKHGD